VSGRQIPLSAIREAATAVYDAAIRTPLVQLQPNLYLKLETLQPIGSFKIRGAYNVVRQLTPQQLADGVWTVSAGNAAQGVALAAKKAGARCSVMVIETAPDTKIRAVERLGATIVRASYDECWKTVESHASDRMTGHFVHPFDDDRFIAGNGTAGLEILEDLPDVEAIGGRFAALETSKGGVAQLSVRDTTRAAIGSATFTVDYGRPLARGRALLGDIIPYDEVWRTGANAATQFSTSMPITLGGIRLSAGTYSLWTVPRTNGVDLIVNKQIGQWGTGYNGKFDLGKAAMGSAAAASPVEKFTISIVSTDAHHGTLVMEWGTFRWTAPIVVA